MYETKNNRTDQNDKCVGSKERNWSMRLCSEGMDRKARNSAIVIGIALLLVMAPSIGNIAYAAKAAGGGGSSSSGGGGDKGGGGGSSSSSDSGSGKSSSGSGKGSDSSSGSSSGLRDSGSSTGSKKGIADNGVGGSVRIPAQPQQPNPHDDGFTKFDGPQPKNPQFSTGQPIIKHGPIRCSIGCFPPFHDSDQICRGNICIPKIHDHFTDDRHHHHHDNVDVIQKTVVVHDHNNNEQTIIVNANTQGTCFVTQTQIANSEDILQTLLDQCLSITIVQG